MQTTIPDACGIASKPEDAIHTTRWSIAIFSPDAARYSPMELKKMFSPPAEEPVIAAITLIEISAVISGFASMFTRAVVMLS